MTELGCGPEEHSVVSAILEHTAQAAFSPWHLEAEDW
jgi:hypothetical protein